MGSEWETRPASEFCRSVRDGTHASPKQTGNGCYLVTSRHITSNRLDLTNAYTISQTDFDEINERSKVDCWDVLITMIGTVGEPCLIAEEPNFAIKNIGLFKSRGEIDGKWLYYLLLSPESQQYITSHSRGSTQQYIPLGELRSFPVSFPSDRVEMETIVDILGTLDDKIELNRQMNRTLEAIARAIFKAWFVDFEPVKAKAVGATSFRGMSQAVFDQLPDRLTDTELGPVPEGWEVGVLEDILYERKDRAKPSEETLRLPYVPIDCITSMQISLESWKSGEEAKSSLVKFYRDDILFGAMRPYFHKACLAPFEGTTRTTCFVLSSRMKQDRAFGVMLASEDRTVEYATSYSVGSTIPYAKWDGSLASMPCVIPPPDIRHTFGELVDPALEICQQLVGESRTLAAIRDTLLPKLISGELRVPAAAGGADGG